MSNVFRPGGQILGAPGPTGSPAVIHFFDAGDPNTRSDPDSMLAGCALGSMYSRIDGPDSTHCLYVKTAQPVAGTSPTGTWTAK
jgi:hypothetical protein